MNTDMLELSLVISAYQCHQWSKKIRKLYADRNFEIVII